jgi:hypothetical protein
VTALAWVAGAALVLLAALGLAMTMRATTDTAARDAAKRDREELARRASLRVVLDEHTARVARFVAVHDDGHRVPLDESGSYQPDRAGRWHIESEDVTP